MSTYRVRVVEVQALDLGDGRHLLASEPPRYMPSPEFLAAFELVEEKRAIHRRTSNGRGRSKGRHARREKNGNTPAKPSGRKHSAERVMGLELWNAGNEVPTIAKTIGKAPSLVHYWRKKDKWPEHKKAPAAPSARTAVTTVRGAAATKDDNWMN